MTYARKPIMTPPNEFVLLHLLCLFWSGRFLVLTAETTHGRSDQPKSRRACTQSQGAQGVDHHLCELCRGHAMQDVAGGQLTHLLSAVCSRRQKYTLMDVSPLMLPRYLSISETSQTQSTPTALSS